MGKCPLTGQTVATHQRGSEMIYDYETPITGKVAFSDMALMAANCD